MTNTNNILQTICDYKRAELVALKNNKDVRKQIAAWSADLRKTYSMRAALANSPTGIIAEFKRKSPSLGWIAPDSSPEIVPVAYEQAGATALSILTNEEFFGGSPDFICRARPLVQIPILRKEFILDEYQLYEACAIGADAILLIAACLTVKECHMLSKKANELGLEVLLELHCEEELGHINDYVAMVGVNNRDLKTFQVSIENSLRLSSLIPAGFLKISESGLKTAEDLHCLREAGYQGFLMGECFMKTPNPALALQTFLATL